MNIQENDLNQLAKMQLPFGKYKGIPLIDLPENYVIWFYQKGLPNGKLGNLLGLLYEIKVNGLEYLLLPFKDS